MLIECKLKRPNGTVIELDDTEYKFEADEKGAHVCEVTDQRHIDILLAIPEAYHEAGKKPPKEKPVEVVDEPKYPVDPELWTNKDCNNWAKDNHLNPMNKQGLIDFAMRNGIEVDENINPASIIRSIAKAIVK